MDGEGPMKGKIIVALLLALLLVSNLFWLVKTTTGVVRVEIDEASGSLGDVGATADVNVIRRFRGHRTPWRLTVMAPGLSREHFATSGIEVLGSFGQATGVASELVVVDQRLLAAENFSIELSTGARATYYPQSGLLFWDH